MELDREHIQIILENQFAEDIYRKVLDSVSELEQGDWLDAFELFVDYVLVDTIEDIQVESWEVERYVEELTVSGLLELSVELEGYAHWDGEDISAGTAEFPMRYAFEFSMIGEECGNLHLEYEYEGGWRGGR